MKYHQNLRDFDHVQPLANATIK